MKNTSSNAPQPPELNHVIRVETIVMNLISICESLMKFSFSQQKNAEEEERPEDQTIKGFYF